jgi:hypothetical protein
LGTEKADKVCHEQSLSIVPIERAIMNYCSDQMNLTALIAEYHDNARNLNRQIALARAQVEKTGRSVQKFFSMIEEAVGDAARSVPTVGASAEGRAAASRQPDLSSRIVASRRATRDGVSLIQKRAPKRGGSSSIPSRGSKYGK